MASNAIVPHRQRNGQRPPSTANSRAPPPPCLPCNLCAKPLVTACFLCACDCIFCEDCTYKHFERNSECPKCKRVLREQDFTELVVTDDSNGGNEAANGGGNSKSSLQTLFSRQRPGTQNLPFSDLCYHVIRQIDVCKQGTKFLLKQLLMDTSTSQRRCLQSRSLQHRMREEITRLKQVNQSQKLQFEKVHTDLRRKLQAREQDIQELQNKLAKKEKQIEQFRMLHSANIHAGSATVSSRDGQHHQHHAIPFSDTHHHHSQRHPQQPTPPLRGIMQQKEAKEQQHRQMLRQTRTGGSNGQNRPSSILGSLPQRRGGLGSNNRPFSNTSNSGAPGIRELSSASGYTFTAHQTHGAVTHSNQINKRRRIPGHSPHHILSPNTAFVQNSSGRSSQWSSGSTNAFRR